jgi:predicted transcriptional regulator
MVKKMKNRSRTELLASMLTTAIVRPATKTRIMYTSFLSYGQLQDYLSLLIDNGLLKHDKTSQTYSTTEKGLKFLRMQQQIEGLIHFSVLK